MKRNDEEAARWVNIVEAERNARAGRSAPE